MSRVPFVVATVGKCLCPRCPVQANSKCVADLKVGLAEALKNSPLKHEKIPGAYCAAGKASCSDLDPTKSCICGNCPIFTQYTLASSKPVGYYCRDGMAK